MILGALILGVAAPAAAKWTEVAAARMPVAHTALIVMAEAGWNRWSKHPIKAGECGASTARCSTGSCS